MIVCDGFIGNVALKVSEGLVDMVKHMLQRVARSHHHAARSATCSPRPPSPISRSAWTIPNTAARRCWASRGVCIICHGRSNANAIKNAIRVAAEFSSGQINHRIEHEIRRWSSEALAAAQAD